MGKTHGVARFADIDGKNCTIRRYIINIPINGCNSNQPINNANNIILDETFYAQAHRVYQVYNVDELSGPEKDARESIFRKSDQTFLKNRKPIVGYDFNCGIDYELLFNSFVQQGFQAKNFSRATEILNLMIDKKEEKERNCRIFFGYTSNMVSCGNREIIRYIVEHKKIDCIVTTAGGIEEDIIKCFASTYNGDFNLNGNELRQKAISRIGNLLIANDNYSAFEQFLIPLLNNMLREQNINHVNWTPSKMIEYMGKEINNEQSIYYWAWKNNIPVFCPAITDGSIGDLIFFHSLQHPGLKIDIAEDVQRINMLSINSSNTGCLILGGGIVKHHILNANAMRSGADYAVIINTAMEYDGSDSGANLDEAVSWAKIRPNAQTVKVVGDASILFPLLVARTFARHDSKNQKQI